MWQDLKDGVLSLVIIVYIAVILSLFILMSQQLITESLNNGMIFVSIQATSALEGKSGIPELKAKFKKTYLVIY